jgi:hypothetical protein
LRRESCQQQAQHVLQLMVIQRSCACRPSRHTCWTAAVGLTRVATNATTTTSSSCCSSGGSALLLVKCLLLLQLLDHCEHRRGCMALQ